MATQPTITHFPGSTPTGMVGRPLATKMARVLAEVHRVPKNGRNDFHNYDYVTESDLVDHIRDKLAEQGVALFPSVASHETVEMQDARNRTVNLVTVTLEITMIDGESGDCMVTSWVGQALDNGDKGYYKAYTGALKYFLLKTFLISTGEDPEVDDAPRPTQGMRHGQSGSVVDSRKPRQHQNAPRPTPTPAPQPPQGDATPDVDPVWKEQADRLQTLLDECVDADTRTRFTELYVQRMGAETLEDIEATKLKSMSRRLSSMAPEQRAAFVLDIVQKS